MESEPEPTNAQHHSTEEVADALGSLTTEQYKRLWSIAKNRIAACGLDSAVYDPDGLFAAVVEASLREDGKKWKVGIPLEAHLCMAMRNIADHLARRSRPTRLLDELSDAEDVGPDAADSFAQDPESVREHVDTQELASRIEAALSEDPPAFQIVSHKLRGFSASEIKRALGLTENQYQAALKRIQRNKKLIEIHEHEKERHH